MAGEYHDLKKQHYLNLIRECAHSGKNKRQWCSENGIKYATFMHWQALLRDEAAEQVMEQQAKAKSVTKATAMKAFHQVRQVQEAEGCVSDPKKLGTFGASYLYPVFLRIGVCSKKSEIF